MVDQALSDDDLGVDLENYQQEVDQSMEDSFVDLESYAEKTKQEPTWGETVTDWLVQSGRGALRAFTWPADIIKLAMVGEGLSGADELESAFQKEGKEFDKNAYVQSVLEQSRFIPTQESAEELFTHLSGFSLEPKTDSGKRIKQFSELLSFARGGALKKLTSAGTGVAVTEGLKQAGVGEGKAELVGRAASVLPSLVKSAPRDLSKAAQELEKTANKHALPFKEFMVREQAPALKGKLFKKVEDRLKQEFNLSTQQAIKKIVDNELPLSRLRNRGVNLDALGKHAYDVTDNLAKSRPQIINTSPMVTNIDNEISRIKNLAPSPSDAQKAQIKLLESERDILKVSNPTVEQVLNQHKNYNADLKSLYKKPEFSGKEEQVRKTYEFLKKEQVSAIENQGHPDVANAFKAANKIWHEKSKLQQTESLLSKAFDGTSYNPKKLDSLLNSKSGNFIKRNLSKDAVKDLEDIAKFGKEAQNKMPQFLNLNNPTVESEIQSWGKMAPILLLPYKPSIASVGLMKPFGRLIQGKLLTQDATRKSYKVALKHASEGAFNLLKRNFAKLEDEISKEWGSVDDFLDDSLSDLDVYDE